MITTIVFKDSKGNVLTQRQFQPGQQIQVTGHVTGLLGLGEPGQSVTLDISNHNFSPVYASDTTSILGNFVIPVTLPTVSSKANVTINIHSIGGVSQQVIPISIGSVIPDTLPDEPSSGSSYIVWGVIGVVAILAMTLIGKKRIGS